MKRNRILTMAVSILTVLLALVLCAAVLGMYLAGMAWRARTGSVTEPIFTRELAVYQMHRIWPVLIPWLLALIAAGIWGEKGKKPLQGAQSPERTLALLRARLGKLLPEARREAIRRRRIVLGGGAVLALCAVWALAWLLNGQNFASRDLEAVMGAMIRHVLPPLMLAFAVLLIAGRFCAKSRAREREILLAIVKETHPPAAKAPMKGIEETPRRAWLRVAFLVIAAGLILIGIFNGGLNDVFVKAINICTECIGLG